MRRLLLSSLLSCSSILGCGGPSHNPTPPATDAAIVADDTNTASDAPAATCDARIGAKQASCDAPPSLAQYYRNMWCGMSPSDADIDCFVAQTCAQMESEIHAGRFPCIGSHP